MNSVIRKYYEDNKVPEILLKQKMIRFEQNPDIASEFEYWIENKTYKTDGAVDVEGYTAKNLTDESQYLDGEGVFMLMIDLRDNPKKALSQIAKGFKIK